MKPIFRHLGMKGWMGGGGFSMRNPVLILVLLAAAGCAPLAQNIEGREGRKKFNEAETAFREGKFGYARTAYLALADDRSDPQCAEQAQFNAAYILVYYKNPDKDFSLAAREFDEFLVRHPLGERADEAGSWLYLIRSFEESKTKELLNEVDSLTRKADDLTKELQKSHADDETAAKERDLLLIEKNALAKKVDDLVKEKAALLNERDGLAKDKIDLENKVALLTRAKAKIEKSLHDLSMVDVKMEKKRKKVQ